MHILMYIDEVYHVGIFYASYLELFISVLPKDIFLSGIRELRCNCTLNTVEVYVMRMFVVVAFIYIRISVTNSLTPISISIQFKLI